MKFLDLNGVSILWQRIKETFARKSETISEISRDDTTFTVTRADGTTFEFDQKDTTYANATTTTAGLMSAADKAKLNGVAEGAQENIIESISVNDVEQQVTSKGVNIAVPTSLSQLSDDVGYLTEESDPTVPQWAKQPQKPAYTASEVGALPDDTAIPSKVSDLENDADYVSFEDIPVKTVNGKTGDVEITAADLGALTEHQDISGKANIADLAKVATSGSYTDLANKPSIPTVPTKVSAFTNDADYANEQYVDNAITAALADVAGIEYRVCGEGEYNTQTFLPTIEGKAGVIYLVPKPLYLIGDATVDTATVSGNNIYYEFIYNGNSFKMIGDTSASLDGYLNEGDVSEDSEVQTMLTQIFGGE